MNLEKVAFAFFIVLALTLNFGFFLGEIDNPSHHDAMELGAALAVSLIATVVKFGDRSQLGAVMLATSLVADLQLLLAAIIWTYVANVAADGVSSQVMVRIVSLSGGALLANLVSVTLLVAETVSIRR
jgi:putative Ca2+/H+ antiporter (TMEM165/GDT1 family)